MMTSKKRRGRDLRDLRDLTGIELRPYLRVSRADQQDKHRPEAERSTSTQRRIFHGYVSREGAVAGPEYSDPDITGSRFGAKKGESDFDAMIRLRPNFECMVNDIRRGDLDGKGLWFWEIERQQRWLGVFAGLRDLCRERGVFWVVRDRVEDPANPGDMLKLGIQSMIAEGESEKLSVRVYDGKQSSALKGKRAGRIPYGFKRGPWDPKAETFGPDQADYGDLGGGPAAVVAEVYERLAEGESLTGIVKDLNARGIRTRSGAQWYAQTVRNMALNPAYAGLRVYQRDQHATLADAILSGVKGNWPALVAEATWWRVHRLLTSPTYTYVTKNGKRQVRPRTVTTPGPRYGVHLLSSIITCATCGGKLVRRGSDGGGRNHPRESYFCRDHSCVGIDKASLDAFVSQRMVAWLSDPGVAAGLRALGDSAAERAARAEADKADAELAGWRKSVALGKVTRETAEAVEPGLLERIEAARRRLAELSPPRVPSTTVGPQARAGWDALDVSVQRRIIAELADIQVHPVGRGHGGREPVHPVYRVSWTWKLGPARWNLGPAPGATIPPLSWEEHKAELAEIRALAGQRRDYVSAERRGAITKLLRADPELADREIARQAGRIDRHAIRRVRHELEQAGEIRVIRRPDRWHVIDHGYITNGQPSTTG